jgi:outer membrane cobalamin receptor
LILLDGIPLNDPFAGYVLWSQVPLASVSSVLIQPGSGAGLFGNSALAGTIFLISKPISTNTASLDGLIGNAETYETSFDAIAAGDKVGVAVVADRFSTAGYPVIAANQRGPVDRNASAESSLVDLRATWDSDSRTTLSLRGRWFEDQRGNGTPFTGNHTYASDFSAVVRRKIPGQLSEVQVSAYGQRRKFSSTFSSVNTQRTTEAPALDQFDVPMYSSNGLP